MRAPLLTLTWLTLTTSLVACGGSKPEAESPETSEAPASSEEKTEAADSEDVSSTADKVEKSEDKAEKASEAEKAPAEAAKPARTAKDVVSRPDVLYMFSFSASEPYQEAEKKCETSAKDDPKKKADCMTKAGKKFDSDGMAFMQKDEKWWWLTVARKGQGLVTLHKFEFEWGEDGEKQVTIKPKGPDKGTKPKGGAPKELVVEVVSDSEIAVKDPKLGRLVYEAKLGLMGDQQR